MDVSVRQGILALLSEGPKYGFQLRAEFEHRTGGTWPLNVGQVYTTLARLQRDGFVLTAGEPDDEGRIAYQLTDAGHAENLAWFAKPVTHSIDPRDELSIKLAIGVGINGVDITEVIQTQRTATLQQLQEYTRLKREAVDTQDLAWELVLERLLFGAESQIRWLDHVESRVKQAQNRPAKTPETAPAPREKARS